MRGQDREINGPGQPFPNEFCRPQPVDGRPNYVMGNITDKKYGRNRAGTDHAGTMSMYVAAKDEKEPGDQENTAHGIQRGIQMREDL